MIDHTVELRAEVPCSYLEYLWGHLVVALIDSFKSIAAGIRGQ